MYCYVGIEFNKAVWTVTLWNIHTLNPDENGFKQEDITDLLDSSDELLVQIKTDFSDAIKTHWITIHALSEATRWISLGFSWTFSGTLAYGLTYMVSDKIQWVEIKKDNQLMTEVLQKAQKFEEILRFNNNEGQNSYHVLIGENKVSLLSFNNKRKLTFLEPESNYLDNKLEYGLIYSWYLSDSKYIEQQGNLRLQKDNLDEFKKDFLDTDASEWIDYWSCEKFFRLQTIDFIREMEWVIKHTNTVENFLLQGRRLCNAFENINGQSDFLEDIYKYFYKNTDLSKGDFAIIPLYSSVNGWSFIWYWKRWMTKDHLTKALESLEVKYPNAKLLINSAPRGKSFNTQVEIHQDRTIGYSTDVCKVQWYILESKNWRQLIQDYNCEELSVNRILIDSMSRKLYINWEGTTSKEIFSQQTTIDLLNWLLKSKNNEVKSSQLPTSSYTQSKSEMSSKILTPLIRTLTNRTNKPIRINCRGDLSDFVIKFEVFDIDIINLKQVDNTKTQ